MGLFGSRVEEEQQVEALAGFEEETSEEQEQPQTVSSGPILAVDIGSVHTRAILLDMVEGMYTFVAHGESPTTTGEPWNDVLEGVYETLTEVTEISGRDLVDQSGDVIQPEEAPYYGVDQFVATASAGQPIRTVLVGLMPDVSLESARRAAASIYLSVVETISLEDRRNQEQQVNALIQADADLILIVGGTDGGALDTVSQYLETVTLAYSLMDVTRRPPMVYAGNNELVPVIEEVSQQVGIDIYTAPNVRPTLDIEYLEGAQETLASLYHHRKAANTPGYSSVGTWTKRGVFPTAHGFGRMVHVLGDLYEHNVLGIDLGSMATAVAASLRGERYLNVFGDLGIGDAARDLTGRIKPRNVARWLTFEVDDDDEIIDYIWNKSLYPGTVPASSDDLEMELAIAREAIRVGVLSARRSWRGVSRRGLLPMFGTILLSGSTLTRTPTPGYGALTALDSLLPRGVTRILLDPYGLASALGVIAPHNPQAVVQTIDSNPFYELGTFISLEGRARPGDVVLQGSIKRDGEDKSEPFEVKYSTIHRLPLAIGQRATLTLQPHRVEIAGIGRNNTLTVTGGELGVVIDARGRPWRMPSKAEVRHQMIADWQQEITQES